MNPAPLRTGTAPRAGVLAALALVVLAAHAWLLSLLPGGAGLQREGQAAVLQTREILVERPPAPEASPAAPARAAARRPPAARRAVAAPATVPVADPPVAPGPAEAGAAAGETAGEPAAAVSPAAEPAPTTAPAEAAFARSDLPAQPLIPPPDAEPAAADEAAAVPAPASAATPGRTPEPGAPTPLLALAAVAATPTAAGPASGERPWPTRLPPPATLHYELHRGIVSGQGALVWKPGADRYELSLDGNAFGLAVLNWDSQGGLDAAGLAPRRFVDRRRGRDARAANFERDKGRISWSGNEPPQPLAAGAQDRLSWMLQLAAIVEADPPRFVRGERVSMWVAGARGDADVWTFTVTGRETLELVGGSRLADTLLFRREPRKAHDTQVEVWLDPSRHHLPARLRLTSLPGGDATEFVLRP